MAEANIWCWLIPVLIGIVSGVLGYFWGKSNGSSADPALTDSLLGMEQENKRLKTEVGNHLNRIGELEKELVSEKSAAAPTSIKKPKKKAVKKTLPSTENSLLSFDADAVKKDYGKRVKYNDLKIIEGIGPKIEGLFLQAGVNSWEKLAATSVEECQGILKSGGDRFKMHDPGSWPIQAGLAHENQWKELAKWQEEHKGGKL